MHAQRCARERAADRIGIGQGLQEVAAARPEHVDLAAPGGLDHLRRGETTMRGNVEAVVLAERAGVLISDGKASRERGRVRAHLGAALHAGVAADRHESRAGATDVASREREIDDPLHAFRSADVLRDAHRPHQHRRARVAVRFRERAKLLDGASGGRSEIVERRRGEHGTELVETDRVLADERFVDPAVLDQDLQGPAHEREIAAGVDGEEGVGHLRAEDRTLDARGHPVVLEPRLAKRVDDHDPGPPLPREIEVLHEDRLRVCDIGAEQDDEVALDHVTVRARRRRDTDRRS